MAFIRPFRSSDTEDAKHICRTTLPPTLAASKDAYTMAPYLWTLQYTHLFPEHCFVVDDGSGKAVGYVIGVPDVFAFEAAYPRYVAEVLQSEQGRADVPVPPQLDKVEPFMVPDPAGGGGQVVNATSMAQNAYSIRLLVLEGVAGKAELARTYRAQLHIDLLEPFQGKGWGKQLIERFVESVKQAPGTYDHGRGIHIGVSGENTKVVPFYEKVGFKVYPGGEREGNLWMVRDV